VRAPLAAVTEHGDALALEGLGRCFRFCCHFISPELNQTLGWTRMARFNADFADKE
jgi:hypothetical protein